MAKAKKKSSRGRKQDRARAAGGQIKGPKMASTETRALSAVPPVLSACAEVLPKMLRNIRSRVQF
jgi:hypothetical protein